MDDKNIKNNDLNEVFNVMKEQSAHPSEELMARVLEDALAVQPDAPVVRTHRMPRNFVRELIRLLGGWPAVGGLVTATVAGVWIGAFPPGVLSDAAGVVLGLNDTEFLIDISPDAAFNLAEEVL